MSIAAEQFSDIHYVLSGICFALPARFRSSRTHHHYILLSGSMLESRFSVSSEAKQALKRLFSSEETQTCAIAPFSASGQRALEEASPPTAKERAPPQTFPQHKPSRTSTCVAAPAAKTPPTTFLRPNRLKRGGGGGCVLICSIRPRRWMKKSKTAMITLFRRLLPDLRVCIAFAASYKPTHGCADHFK